MQVLGGAGANLRVSRKLLLWWHRRSWAREAGWRWMSSVILNTKSMHKRNCSMVLHQQGTLSSITPFPGCEGDVNQARHGFLYLLRRCSCIYWQDFYFLLYYVLIFSKFKPWHVLLFFLNYKNNPKFKKSVTTSNIKIHLLYFLLLEMMSWKLLFFKKWVSWFRPQTHKGLATVIFKTIHLFRANTHFLCLLQKKDL